MEARNYCAANVCSCFHKLGFSNKACKNLLRTVSRTSIETSFEIWKSRNNKAWTLDAEERTMLRAQSQNSADSKDNEISFNKSTLTATSQSADISLTIYDQAINFVGLMNKGNTCYANCILQCLKNLPEFVHKCISEGKDDQLLSAFTAVMRQMSTSSSPVDPSGFLKALQVVIRASGNKNFNFNSQQDAAEVLQHVLDNMSKDSPIAALTVSE